MIGQHIGLYVIRDAMKEYKITKDMAQNRCVYRLMAYERGIPVISELKV